jgi:hypothetical protein
VLAGDWARRRAVLRGAVILTFQRAQRAVLSRGRSCATCFVRLSPDIHRRQPGQFAPVAGLWSGTTPENPLVSTDRRRRGGKLCCHISRDKCRSEYRCECYDSKWVVYITARRFGRHQPRQININSTGLPAWGAYMDMCCSLGVLQVPAALKDPFPWSFLPKNPPDRRQET